MDEIPTRRYWEDHRTQHTKHLNLLLEYIPRPHDTHVALMPSSFTRARRPFLGEPPERPPSLDFILDIFHIPSVTYNKEQRYQQDNTQVINLMYETLQALWRDGHVKYLDVEPEETKYAIHDKTAFVTNK